MQQQGAVSRFGGSASLSEHERLDIAFLEHRISLSEGIRTMESDAGQNSVRQTAADASNIFRAGKRLIKDFAVTCKPPCAARRPALPHWL
ncbi:hypothetical protein [Streptomyces sp. KL2]|uniref:hypothetical protein n=1 Tax=Streptomyces sp. KL2 TaxID=3050126 RepID=UPI003978D7DD